MCFCRDIEISVNKNNRVTLFSKICDLAAKYHALVFIDECHATGFFGETGR